MGLKVGESIIILLGILFRLVLYFVVNNDFLKSVTYSATDRWTSILEAVAYKSVGVSVYQSDVALQPPIVLAFFSSLHFIFAQRLVLIFLLLDLASYQSLIKLSVEVARYLGHQSDTTVYDESSKSMALRPEELKKLRLFFITAYSLNPYLIVSFGAMNITAFYCLLHVQLLINLLKNQHTVSMALCAVAAYCQLYSIFFILPIICNLLKNKQNLLKPLGVFLVTMCCLFGVSGFMEGNFIFVETVYKSILTYPDPTPHFNFYWYFHVEMFDHFREFFIAFIQLLIAISCIGLSVKEQDDPLFLMFAMWLFIAIVKIYPSIGELGMLLALWPMWTHLYTKGTSHFNVLPLCMLSVAMVLAPLMHYLWLYAGSANANFYFAITMLHCFAETMLLGSLLRLHSQRQLEVQYGLKPTVDGEELKATF